MSWHQGYRFLGNEGIYLSFYTQKQAKMQVKKQDIARNFYKTAKSALQYPGKTEIVGIEADFCYAYAQLI